MRTVHFAPLAAAVLFVTACGPGTPDASPSPSGGASATPTVSATATPSPSPSLDPAPSFDPYPDPAELVISSEGISPLGIGLSAETNPGSAMITFLPNDCYSEEWGTTTGDLDRWVANYPAVMDPYGNPKDPFYVAVSDSIVWRIDVFDDAMPTTEGITIGSTIDQLQAAYPDLTEGTPGPVSRVFWQTGTNGYLVFEVQDPDLGLGVAGATGPEEVILIRVIANTANPDFAAANSGDVAGSCST